MNPVLSVLSHVIRCHFCCVLCQHEIHGFGISHSAILTHSVVVCAYRAESSDSGPPPTSARR